MGPCLASSTTIATKRSSFFSRCFAVPYTRPSFVLCRDDQPLSTRKKNTQDKQGNFPFLLFFPCVPSLARLLSCFVTTKTGDLRDDACGDGREGGEGSFKIDAAVGYTFGIDDGNGLGGAGAQVGANDDLTLNPIEVHTLFKLSSTCACPR